MEKARRAANYHIGRTLGVTIGKKPTVDDGVADDDVHGGGDEDATGNFVAGDPDHFADPLRIVEQQKL